MMIEKEIEVVVQELPDQLKVLVLKYVKQLSKDKDTSPFKFSWKGGLSDLNEQYTSIELQHRVLEWR